MTEVLVGCLRAQAVVVGHDFHFGHRRQGDVALLQRMGAVHGFDVHGLRLMAQGPDGLAVSSTRIRELLGAGDVEQAATLLGRPHEVRGRAAPAAAAGQAVGGPGRAVGSRRADAPRPWPGSPAWRTAPRPWPGSPRGVPLTVHGSDRRPGRDPDAGRRSLRRLVPGPGRWPRPSLLSVGRPPGPAPADTDAVIMEARLLDGGGPPRRGPPRSGSSPGWGRGRPAPSWTRIRSPPSACSSTAEPPRFPLDDPGGRHPPRRRPILHPTGSSPAAPGPARRVVEGEQRGRFPPWSPAGTLAETATKGGQGRRRQAGPAVSGVPNGCLRTDPHPGVRRTAQEPENPPTSAAGCRTLPIVGTAAG